jgi:DNA-binding PadR family transcriptional regulator
MSNINKQFPHLSHKEFVILEMLVSRAELFGLEMVAASDGQLKKGTIYVTLQRMSEKNLVESRQEARGENEIGIARRKYKATAFGERVYRAQEIALKYLNLNGNW